MQPSRRAFLLGKRPPRSVWLTFCERLEAVATGPLETLGEQRARLLAADAMDARIARRLCAEYGVTLALAGTAAARPAAAAGPCLVVDPGRLTSVRQADGRWHVAPGARVGGLLAAGLTQFESEIPSTPVGLWLAQAGGWLTSGTAASGLVGVKAVLADGTVETFGAFGAAATQPLQSVTVQRLVPALFELLRGEAGRACLAAPAWAPRHRLDALDGAAVNLAQVFLGHGGALAWIEELVFEPGGAAPALPPAPDPALAGPARQLDARVRALFDPAGCYAEAGPH